MFSWATPARLAAPRSATPITATLSFSLGPRARRRPGAARAEAAEAARNRRRVGRGVIGRLRWVGADGATIPEVRRRENEPAGGWAPPPAGRRAGGLAVLRAGEGGAWA